MAASQSILPSGKMAILATFVIIPVIVLARHISLHRDLRRMRANGMPSYPIQEARARWCERPSPLISLITIRGVFDARQSAKASTQRCPWVYDCAASYYGGELRLSEPTESSARIRELNHRGHREFIQVLCSSVVQTVISFPEAAEDRQRFRQRHLIAGPNPATPFRFRLCRAREDIELGSFLLNAVFTYACPTGLPSVSMLRARHDAYPLPLSSMIGLP